jgi:hypothetical protein
MALKDILSNPKYADDMVITIGEGANAETVKVGEIRALPFAERQALTSQLTERINNVSQAELVFASKFQEAVNKGWLAADDKGNFVVPARQQAPPTVAQVRAAAAQELGVDENDPLLGPVVKMFKQELATRDQTLTELRAEMAKMPGQFDSLKSTLIDGLGKVNGVVNTSVGRYLNDQYQSQFAAATKDLPKGVTVGYEDAYKYASERQLKDKDGFLLINEAVDRLTWKERQKAELAAERAELIAKTTKDIEEQSRIKTLTPPQSRNALHTAPVKDGEFNPFNERTDSKGNKVKVVKSFEEAMGEAMNDDDVLKSALSAASFGGAAQ